MQDVTYTELIILEYRDRTELADAKHDNKINMQDVTQIELVILDAMDKVVGVGTCLVTKEYSKVFFPEFQNLPTIGGWEVDYEAIPSLNPDVLIVYGAQSVEDEKLPGVTRATLRLLQSPEYVSASN